MRNNLLFAVCLFLVVACQENIDKEFSTSNQIDDNRIKTFYATTENENQATKVYADENLKVLWNADDRLSVFNKSTYNFQYRYTGVEGSNAGGFDEITPSGLITGNSLDNIYAVYPYASGNTINNSGSAITVNLPAEQSYREHSFGVGANTMVAVTDNNFLAFKNVGGYLMLRLYGDDVSVSRITLQGNNGEKIAGKAVISVGVNTLPSVVMDNSATGIISIVCDTPVPLGTSSSNCTEFWFVVPPTTFANGIKITITDALGGTFQASATSSLTIERSTREKMLPLKVTPNYDNVMVQIPDTNFKTYLVENFDENNDGEISISEARLVERIIVREKSITSLEGIEFFTNLMILDCGYNQLTTLDVRHNIELLTLYCNNNQLTTLNVSHNPALKKLACYRNQLTTLNVSNNTALQTLNCSSNQLTTLDVSDYTALQTLNCGGNQLTTLNVSNDTALRTLSCDGNQLTTLNVSNNTALQTLSCKDNQLTTLNVNTALQGLRCDYNQLTTLDVSQNTALKDLNCDYNQLTTLNVSNNTALQKLNCGCNQLTSLDVSNNTALQELGCGGNQLTTLNVSNNTALQTLYCGHNQLTTLNVSDNTALLTLYCNDNQLTTLNVSNNTALQILQCTSNQLTTLDIRQDKALQKLDCGCNQLTSLDVSNNTELQELYCSGNPYLTEIWLKTNQTIPTFWYDSYIATIYYK